MIAIKDRWATILWEFRIIFIKEAIVVLNTINTLDFWVWSFSHSIFWVYARIISQTVCLPHRVIAVHRGSKRVLQDLACENCYVKSLMASLALRNGIFGEHTAKHRIFYHVEPQSSYAEELESLQ